MYYLVLECLIAANRVCYQEGWKAGLYSVVVKASMFMHTHWLDGPYLPRAQPPVIGVEDRLYRSIHPLESGQNGRAAERLSCLVFNYGSWVGQPPMWRVHRSCGVPEAGGWGYSGPGARMPSLILLRTTLAHASAAGWSGPLRFGHCVVGCWILDSPGAPSDALPTHVWRREECCREVHPFVCSRGRRSRWHDRHLSSGRVWPGGLKVAHAAIQFVCAQQSKRSTVASTAFLEHLVSASRYIGIQYHTVWNGETYLSLHVELSGSPCALILRLTPSDARNWNLGFFMEGRRPLEGALAPEGRDATISVSMVAKDPGTPLASPLPRAQTAKGWTALWRPWTTRDPKRLKRGEGIGDSAWVSYPAFPTSFFDLDCLNVRPISCSREWSGRDEVLIMMSWKRLGE